MLVKDCMTRHPIMVPPTMAATEAQKMMQESHVRHLPVVGSGKKLLGLVTRDRLAIKPDIMGSLNVWEITRYLSNLTVKDIMLDAKAVHTIEPDRTVERAARYFSEHKIGCLPVIEDDMVVGMLSEVDVLHAFQEMLGLPAQGVRVTMRMPNKQGEFTKLMKALSDQGWGVMGVGTFPSRRVEGMYDAVLKIPNVNKEQVREVLSRVPEQELVDVRDVV